MGARTREDIDKDNAQRMQRVSLWVARADAPRTMTPHIANVDDAAIRFIFYWIAFESAFAVKVSTDNARMEKFINDAVGMDALAFGKILRTNNRHAMVVMELPMTHEGFWQRNNMKTHAAWRRQFDRELEEFLAADVAAKLCVLFRRLRVIRNHIFHGASSRHRSFGVTQAKSGAKILAAAVPKFKTVIEASLQESPPHDWGRIPFPPQGSKHDRDNKFLLPFWKEV